MIPTVLVTGLVLGLLLRTWWSIPAVALGWVALVADTLPGETLAGAGFVGAGLIGAANAGVGVALGRGLRVLGSAGSARAGVVHRRGGAPV